jgi:membrane protein required for beta-lactamase induction
MSRLARSVGIARPRQHQAWGLYYALTGKGRRAMRHWRRGLADAERLKIPYEEALLLSSMLNHGELSADRAATYLERAATIFETLGAAPDLANLDAKP